LPAESHRIYRVEHEGRATYAVERGGTWRLATGSPFEAAGLRETDAFDPSRARLVAPVVPSKIVAIGLNYKDHAAEQNKPLPKEPMIFIKPSTAVVGPGEPIRVSPDMGRVDHEAEAGVVIGRRAYRVPASRAWEYVLGLTCVNDVTARELQKKDIQYTRAKGFDSFAPLGPCIAAGLDAGDVAVEGWVNGERRQSSSTRELIFDVPALVAFVSSVMTLLPGDIISTGTPAGIGPIKPGDTVTIKVAGVGELSNPVEAL
jgi:2-keto-4-pentenoate hydratase/2-oxohepta-3-ene-1,7-dioic acid hydratase in catechol pathway